MIRIIRRLMLLLPASLVLIVLLFQIQISNSIFIEIFNQTKAYQFNASSLRTVNSKQSSKYVDYSNHFYIDDNCSNKTYVNSTFNSAFANYKPLNTNASVLIYQDYNYNLRFMLNITFDSALDESPLDGYQIRFWDPSKKVSSCIRFISRDREHNVRTYRKKFQLIIKDPKLFQSNSNYTFYFGRIAISPLKYCLNIFDNTYHLCRVQTNDLIDIGIKSANTDYDINKEKRNDGNCVFSSTFANTCLDIHNNDGKKRLIVIHDMPATIKEVYNKFGMTKVFHEAVISYERELITKNYAIKIIENVENDATFYYSNELLEPSSMNTCVNSSKGFCKCNSVCQPCVKNQSEDSKMVIVIKLSDNHVSLPCPDLNRKSLSAISFSSNKFIESFQGHRTNESRVIEFNNRLPEMCILIRRNKYLQYTDKVNTYDLDFRINDKYLTLTNRYLNIKYELKLYYLCNNDTKNTTNDHHHQQPSSAYNHNDEHDFSTVNNNANNNCSSVEISRYVFDNPLVSSIKIHSLRVGKYSIELKPYFNNDTNSRYCPPEQCPFLQDDKIYCDTCKKIVYFFDLVNYKANDKESLNYNKPSEEDYECLKNTNKYSGLSSFITLTASDSYEGSLYLYQNKSIFNLNEAFVVNKTVVISVSLELTSETMCNYINIYKITESNESELTNQLSTKKYLSFYFLVIILFLLIIITAAVYATLKYSFHQIYLKKFEKTKVVIYLSIDVTPLEQKEMRKIIEHFFVSLKIHLTHIDFEIIDFDNNIDREDMSYKLEESKLIYYVCDTQDEIKKIQNLNPDEFGIGKKRYYDDYLEIHTYLKEKVSILMFKELTNNDSIDDVESESLINITNSDSSRLTTFFLPKEYKNILMHLMQSSNRKRKNCENVHENCLYKIYENNIMKSYLLLKYFFLVKQFKHYCVNNQGKTRMHV